MPVVLKGAVQSWDTMAVLTCAERPLLCRAVAAMCGARCLGVDTQSQSVFPRVCNNNADVESIFKEYVLIISDQETMVDAGRYVHTLERPVIGCQTYVAGCLSDEQIS